MSVRRRAWAAVAAGALGVLALGGASAAAQPPNPVVPVPTPGTHTAINPAAGMYAPAALPGGVPAAAVPAPALVPATSGTLTEYFHEKKVKLEPQRAEHFKALNLTLPVPTGWQRVPDPNVPDAFYVIADRVGGDGLYTSNAALVIYKLVGDFDPREAITHGFVDSQKLLAWRTTDGGLTEFGGFPSARITGTYRLNDTMLNTSRRHVIAASGPDRFWVSLAVTTTVGQAVPTAGATDAITKGFRVAAAAPAPPP